MILVTSGAVAQGGSAQPDALSETYRDWIVSCRTVQVDDNQSAARLCEMSQDLRQQDGGQRVLSVTLQTDAREDGALLTMITPFGLNVTGQIAIRVGDTEIAEVPFTTCVPAGCIAQVQLEPELLTVIGQGEAASVILPTRSDNPFEVSVSLLGFTAALGRLHEL
jgi:invasion protein IalB